MTWNGNGSGHSYTLSYDGLNRLTTATHGQGRYTEQVTGYDKNGNILGLKRYGQTGASSYALIDNLTYTLDGNRLNRVDDAATAVAYNGGFEFTDRAKQANEYTYDENGNLTKDLNRNISEIRYNCLNLPQFIAFGSAGVNMQLHYRSDGKLMRRTYAGINRPAEYYCGNVVYENSTAKRLLTEEGYVDLTDNSYHYFVRDHQGNNRVVVNGSGTVEEVNHYYPFGGLFATASSVQPYKYNGKELLTQQGLNWYDYGARHYDATLGRWSTIDPMAEKCYGVSPYAYCRNSPLLFIDPSGMIEWPVNHIYNGYKREHSNNYGNSRPNGRTHKGVDINYTNAGNLDLGAPVFATHDGRVVRVVHIGNGDKDAGGNRVKIVSENGEVSTFYMHLNEISDKIKVGEFVSEGQQIGTMGGSGKGAMDNYAVHLHYELEIFGKKVNPAKDSESLIDPQNLITPMQKSLPEVEIVGRHLEPLQMAPLNNIIENSK